MDAVNNGIADLDKLQDDSHELTSGEPVGFFVVQFPIVHEDTSEVHNVQKEQIAQEDPQHHDLDPQVKVSMEDGKSLDGFIHSGQEIEDATSSKPVIEDKKVIDTSAPIESVKNAVSKFGGIVARKAKTRTDEKSRILEHELEKGKEGEEAKRKALKEIESINCLIEELKLKLERAQEEESQAKQDSELARITVMEMEEKGTVDNEQHEDERFVCELKCVKKEMEDLQQKQASLLSEKDVALKRVEDALSKSKEIEKNVEEMKLELVSNKETLESAHNLLLEADEKRNEAAMAKEKDKLVWDEDLKQAKEDMEKLNQQVEVVRDLKGKLNAASEMLERLRSELSGYKESATDEMQTELEGLKLETEKIRDDTESLKVASVALERELEHERSELASLKHREGVASANVAILEAELEKVKSEINAVHSREKEAKERMTDLPMQLEVASQEAGDARSAAESARMGLRKLKEEAEQASILERRVLLVQKEIGSAKASEKLAMEAIKELQESLDSQNLIVAPLEEYNELSKRAQEAKEQANTKAADVLGQVEEAKEDERKILSKLEEANQALLTRKEVYAHAINKAEKENQEKLSVEQELRKWSDENEKRQENGEGASDGTRGSLEGPDSHAPHDQGQDSQIVTNKKESAGSESSNLNSPRQQEQGTSTDTSGDTKHGKKKKKHFFPHMFMLFSKKKASSRTS
ncbi:hypothetical protein V2J09_011754 [Rumex salicifolius]